MAHVSAVNFRTTVFWVSCLVAGAAGAGQQDFRFVAETPSAATIETARYAFQVIAPHSTYLKDRWKRYFDPTTDTTTMVMSTSRGDSYALTVTPLTSASDQTAPLPAPRTILRTRHPEDALAPGSSNPDCATTDWSAPTRIGPDMVIVTAVCAAPGSQQVYELTLSWLSVLLRDDGGSAGSACGGNEGEDCTARIAQMRQSMKVFVDSFQPVGKR